MLLQNNIIKRQFPNVNGELHSLLVKILPGQADDGAGQKQQAHQVGNGHHAVEGIGNVPHEGAGAHRTHDAHEDEGDFKDVVDHLVVVAQIAPAALAVVAPAKDGGQGEEQQANLQDRAADGAGKNGVEGCRRCRAVGGEGAEVIFQHAGEKNGGNRYLETARRIGLQCWKNHGVAMADKREDRGNPAGENDCDKRQAGMRTCQT